MKKLWLVIAGLIMVGCQAKPKVESKAVEAKPDNFATQAAGNYRQDLQKAQAAADKANQAIAAQQKQVEQYNDQTN